MLTDSSGFTAVVVNLHKDYFTCRTTIILKHYLFVFSNCELSNIAKKLQKS